MRKSLVAEILISMVMLSHVKQLEEGLRLKRKSANLAEQRESGTPEGVEGRREANNSQSP
ncbi:hypothetical protein AGQ54_24595 [Salmonella enterica subsp. enterica]|nr:hypothetical protein AGQ54_24595 [Salmonella enterica subsp. enterica]